MPSGRRRRRFGNYGSLITGGGPASPSNPANLPPPPPGGRRGPVDTGSRAGRGVGTVPAGYVRGLDGNLYPAPGSLGEVRQRLIATLKGRERQFADRLRAAGKAVPQGLDRYIRPASDHPLYRTVRDPETYFPDTYGGFEDEYRRRGRAIHDYTSAAKAYRERQQRNFEVAGLAGKARDYLNKVLLDLEGGATEKYRRKGFSPTDKSGVNVSEDFGEQFASDVTAGARRRQGVRFRTQAGQAVTQAANTRQAIRRLRDIIDKGDNYAVVGAAEAIKEAVGTLRDTESGLSGALADIASLPIFAPLQTSYYAGKRAELTGGDDLEVLHSMVAGLPGLGFLAPGGSKARRNVEAVNTLEEREELRRLGQLASFGEFVTGEAVNVLRGRSREEYLNTAVLGFDKSTGLPWIGPVRDMATLPNPDLPVVGNVTSGLFDLGFQVAGDPTFAVGIGLNALARPVGSFALSAADEAARVAAARGVTGTALAAERQAAYRAAAESFLRETATGQGLWRAVAEAAKNPRNLADAQAVSRAFRGLPDNVALEVAEAAGRSSDEALSVIRSSLTSGSWDPMIRPLRTQLRLGALGQAGLGGRVGRSAVRATDPVRRLRTFANSAGKTVAVTGTRSARRIGAEALRVSLEVAPKGVGAVNDFIDRVVARRPKDPIEALTATVRDIERIDHAGLQSYVSQRLNPFLAKFRDEPVRTLTYDPEFQEALNEVDGVLAVARGEAGPKAREQLLEEFRIGFKAQDTGIVKLLPMARRNIGLAATKGPKLSKEDLSYAIDFLPDELQGSFVRRLGRAKDTKGLRRIAADVRDLIDHPELLDEASRLSRMEKQRLAEAVTEGRLKAGFGRKGLSGRAARAALAVVEAAPPSEIWLAKAATPELSIAERADAVALLGSSLGLDDLALSQLKREAAKVSTERELFKFARRPLEIWARQNNVDWRLVQAVLDEAEHAQRAMVQYAEQGTGKAIVGAHTPAQLVERAPLPNPDDLLRAVREEIARTGTWSQRLAENMRVSISKAGDFEYALGMKNPLTNKEITVRTTLKGLHRFWKFMIVTNAYLPMVGAAAAVTGIIDGSAEEGALVGAVAGGVLGGARYVVRVVGIEERARAFIERGFNPPEWVPFISKHYAERGIPLPFRAADYDLVRAGGIIGPQWENRLLQTVDPVWDTVARGDRKFLNSWHRTVYYQLQPDVYEVDRLLLAHRAGLIDDEALEKALKEYGKTEEGKKLLARMRAGVKGPGTWDEFIKRERTFVESYTTPAIAKARLEGMPIDDLRDLMKRELKSGADGIPTHVHGEKSGVGPVASKLYRGYNNLTSNLLLAEPTNRMSRFPMYRWKYRDEYFRRVQAGMDPERAAREASTIAVRNTNEIMFRIDGESRFARKADFVFPFQQPREEFFRVWTKLAYRHPGRVVRSLRLAALAFNNGEQSGLFSRDPFTGEWTMAIPGSAQLSNLLFGHNEKFRFNLRDLLFVAQGTGFGMVPQGDSIEFPVQVLSSSVPAPGGPYWLAFTRLLSNEKPEWFEDKTLFTNWLMPYGPGRDIFRPEARRLWMAVTGSTPPWLFIDDTDAENELKRYTIEVARSLYAKNVSEGMNPDDAWPSDEEVEEATRNFFQAWSFWGTFWPALPRPTFSGSEDFQKFRDTITLGGALPLDRGTVLEARPELAPYLTSNSEWTGPDDYEHWAQPLDRAQEYSLRYRDVMSLDKFRSEFNRFRKEFDAYTERQRIFDMPQTDPTRTRLLDEWEEKNPELAGRTRTNYFRDKELLRILSNVPKKHQEEQLNRWRLRYDVSHNEFKRLRREVPKTFVLNPWREARREEDIVRVVQRRVRNGVSEEAAVDDLSPAEQIHWWNHRIDELDKRWDLNDDPSETLQSYYDIVAKKRKLRDDNPLLNLRDNNPYERFVDRLRGDEANSLEAIFAEISRLRPGIDSAYQRKAWSEYNALRAKRDSLYDLAKIARDSLYERVPDLGYAVDTMREIALANEAKDYRRVQRLNKRLEQELDAVRFIPVNQELSFRAMPKSVQAAYINKLVRSLNFPSTKGADPDLRTFLRTEGYSKLFWDWLPHFQQDLLARHLPPEQIEMWKGESYAAGMRDASAHIRDIPADLSWALQMLEHYDTRKGGTPPRSYEEYLSLPSSPTLRQEFLRTHPEVARWVGQNPLAAMPEPHRSVAMATFTKYGNFGGGRGGRRYGGGYGGENPELAFAYYQLGFWNRRPDGATPPETYDLWLNMPSGPDKAEYLRLHPEIQEWLSLGPMSNMPDEYKDIVRDIMVRYGKWTERDDPLSQTISAYYRTPAFARSKFLEDHPELLAYWNALRGPEEQRLSQLADQYFAIPDANARRMFLASNPELQEYLVEQRTRRYERFLNRVATYMGSNPALFEAYLVNQEEVLRELLRRFGEPTLVRETVRGGSGGERTGGSGRRRRPRY